MHDPKAECLSPRLFALSVNYPWETFDFYQHGYVIELPLKTK